MSHIATAWAIRQELPALQKLVLILLADRHNSDTGVCFPSMKRVAVDAGMSQRSVQNAVQALIEKGLIKARQRKVDDVYLSNEYSFNFKSGGVVQEVHQGGAGGAGGVVHHVRTNQVSINQEENHKQAKPATSQAELPKWIDKDIWAGHLEVRTARRAPKTPRAFAGMVKRLEKFKAEGFDPNAILEASNRSGWVDVFRPKRGDEFQVIVNPLTLAEKMRIDGFE